MVDGPSHRDGSAPVVGCEGEWDVGIKFERADDVVEVPDAGGISPQRGAFAKSHAKLINGYNAVAVTERPQEGGPRVGPCRVSMNADHRGDWCARGSGHGWTRVEDVPPMRATVVAPHVYADRPCRVEPPFVQISNAG